MLQSFGLRIVLQDTLPQAQQALSRRTGWWPVGKMKEWTDGIGWNPFKHGAVSAESSHGATSTEAEREALQKALAPEIMLSDLRHTKVVGPNIETEDAARALPWMIKYGGQGRPLPVERLKDTLKR